jgi:integrase
MEEQFVFEIISASYANEFFREIMNDNPEIEGDNTLTLHGFRHANAVCVSEGHTAAQRSLGHANVQTTHKYLGQQKVPEFLYSGIFK